MWESRVLCEISKRRWTAFCDVHGRVISTALLGVGIGEQRYEPPSSTVPAVL